MGWLNIRLVLTEGPQFSGREDAWQEEEPSEGSQVEGPEQPEDPAVPLLLRVDTNGLIRWQAAS